MRRALLLTLVCLLGVVSAKAQATTGSGTIGTNLSWEYEDGKLTISGIGTMHELHMTGYPWAQYRDNLKTVIIEDGITTIGQSAFETNGGYPALTTVSIGRDVTHIGAAAFANCAAITKIIILADPPTIGNQAFYNVGTSTPICVPEEKSAAYSGWGGFILIAIIQPPGGTTGDDSVSWSYDETTKTLTFSGEGAMGDYDDSDNKAPWSDVYGDGNIKTIIIGEGVTYIGDNAFAGSSFFSKVIMLGETPPTVGTTNVWGGLDEFDIEVPQGTKDAYAEVNDRWPGHIVIVSYYTEINNIDDLKGFRDDVNSGTDYSEVTTELKANIDLAGEDWTPIGTSYSNSFKGTFNGNGYTISNLKISETNANTDRGLFGYVYEATLKDLVLKDVLIESDTFMDHTNTGALIGYARNTTIENCHVISGTIYESITGSTGYGALTGGLIGYFYQGEITLCSNSADILSDGNSADDSSIGGLAGYIEEIKIDRCFNQGTISGIGAAFSQNIGGLAGNTYDIEITNSYNVGNITVSATKTVNTGGIVGYANNATIGNCYSYADITGGTSTDSYTGGLIGSINEGDVSSNISLSKNLTGNKTKTYSFCGSIGEASFSSCYSWLKGLSEVLYGDMLNAFLWDGSMSSKPIAGNNSSDDDWSATTWNIDATDKLMPKLKGLLETITQPDVKNPLKDDDSGSTPSGSYHTITLEVAPGIDLNGLTAGNHQVAEGGHLHLQFLPEDHTLSAADLLLLIDGVETSFSDLGSGNYFSYILNPISQDHTILITLKEYTITLPEIDGATFTPGAGTHSIAYGQPFTFSLDLQDLNDLEDLKVLVNGIALTPDSQVGSVLTFTIGSVTGPVEITVEGLNPTGNANIAEGGIQLRITNYELQIENTTGQAVDVAVYTIAGQNVVSLRALRGSKTITLQPGIYLVRAGNEVYKVSVK